MLDDYFYLDNAVREAEDISLLEFAATDPRRAYKIAKAGLAQIALRGAHAATINGNTVVIAQNAAPKESAVIKSAFMASLPDEDVTDFNFSLNVYPSRDDVEFFGADPAQTTSLVSFHVEPPGLAMS